MLMEGYKFSNGEIRDLTRPQIMFLNEFVKFKINARRGKKTQSYRAVQGKPPAVSKRASGYTPEELAAKKLAQFEATDKFAADAEQKAAKEARDAWEEKWRQSPSPGPDQEESYQYHQSQPKPKPQPPRKLR